jgi:glycosyltransferase involved in cell wall biosynthesis
MSAPALEFVIPGDLQAATGGYGYDRRMIAGLRELGWQVSVHALDASFPQPSAAALVQASNVFARLADHALVLVDGLALGAMPAVVAAHAARLRVVALVHHPLAAESGLPPHLQQSLAHSERLALQVVRHVLVTSRATRRALATYGVDPARVTIVEPGTDPAPLAHGPRGDTPELLCVATVTARKGHELLCAALAALTPQRWHLTCVGSLTRSPGTVARLRAQLRDAALEGRVTLAGEVDAGTLERHYAAASLFVLATRLEGYGMAVAEALAHGLPVISTRVGAIAELVGPAGLLVEPGSEPALRAALRRALTEPGLLGQLASEAAVSRDGLSGWPHACARMSQVLATVQAPQWR